MVKKEILKKFNVLITGAFAFVSALAWNTAIQELFKEIYPTKTGLVAMFTYAIFVTLIAFFVTSWMSKISGKKWRKK
ncbi:MAG TPA: DUF5654 family protein [Candidatus Nanoarchaeia archaeon]|nr:DUF5654 family protein [Candidatus Nanoarchaeia archaeon]